MELSGTLFKIAGLKMRFAEKLPRMGFIRSVCIVAALVLLTSSPVTPQENKGRIEIAVTRQGSTDGIPSVAITLQGPYPMSVSSAQLSALYTPNPTLTPEMNAQVDALIAVAPLGMSAEGIADAAMRLEARLLGLPVPASSPASQTTSPPQQLGQTNSNGHLTFVNLAPGRYQIRAQREGYFAAPPPGRARDGLPPGSAIAVATVEDGQPAMEVSLSMIRGGTISGRLRDPNGQPLPGMPVSAFQITYSNGRRVLQQVNSKPADDRGEYRVFWLPPGEYFVGTIPRRAGNVPNIQDMYVQTFYPGATDARSASLVNIAEGSDVAGIDIAVRGGALAKISGRVVTSIVLPNGQPATGSSFYLMSRDPGNFSDTLGLLYPNAATDRTNGHFEIRGVPPGSYDLIAPISNATVGTQIGRARVEIGNGDVEDIVLNVKPGIPLKVRLTLDTGPVPYTMAAPTGRGRGIAEGRGGVISPAVPAGPVPSPSYRVELRSLEPYPPPFETAVRSPTFEPPGDFVFHNVPESRFYVTVVPMPPNSYIADVRSGPKSIFDDGFEVGSLSGDIEVSVSSKGAKIQGTVRDASQNAISSARVVLVPAANRRQNLALYKTAVTDAKGNFTIMGIAPGGYSVYSWESVPGDAWLNREFMARFDNRGQPVSVTQGKTINANVTLIPIAN